MNSIAAAIIYNLHVAEKELAKNKIALNNERMFGEAKQGRKVVDYEEMFPF